MEAIAHAQVPSNMARDYCADRRALSCWTPLGRGGAYSPPATSTCYGLQRPQLGIIIARSDTYFVHTIPILWREVRGTRVYKMRNLQQFSTPALHG